MIHRVKSLDSNTRKREGGRHAAADAKEEERKGRKGAPGERGKLLEKRLKEKKRLEFVPLRRLRLRCVKTEQKGRKRI